MRYDVEEVEAFAKVLQEADKELVGTYFDPQENYVKKVQIDLRKHLKSFAERCSRGASLLLPENDQDT